MLDHTKDEVGPLECLTSSDVDGIVIELERCGGHMTMRLDAAQAKAAIKRLSGGEEGDGMSKDMHIALTIGLLIALAAAISGMACWWCVRESWRQAAVQHGAAHYDAKTGAFMWNDEKEAKP